MFQSFKVSKINRSAPILNVEPETLKPRNLELSKLLFVSSNVDRVIRNEDTRSNTCYVKGTDE